MMCAWQAAVGGKRVALLDHADRPGKKILISGGGRCNFTNIHCKAENFLSQNRHFAKSALARYTPQDFIALVERHGIAYHEKTLGQLFCDGSARQIVTMLEDECSTAGVELLLNQRVLAVEKDIRFAVRTEACTMDAHAVVIATGGLSIPKMGATGLGYDVARQFELAIVEPRAALVPLVMSAQDRERYCDLSGIAVDSVVACGGHSFRERTLITHRGLSGPAVLQASSYWLPGAAVQIDLAPGADVTASMRAQPAGRDATALELLLRQVFPQRLAERWLELNMPPDGTNRSLAAFEQSLHAWQIVPAGTEGFEKAEVTAGGVDTTELSARTMESRKVPGLYFIGEVVDVTGQLGGFNFQWAWASGAAAGRALSGMSE
jgi:predicted Rossmann fold flavoprotein